MNGRGLLERCGQRPRRERRRGLDLVQRTATSGSGTFSRTGPALSMSSVMPSVGPPGTSPAARIASIAASSSISKNSAAFAGSIRRTISRHIHSSERDSPTGSIAGLLELEERVQRRGREVGLLVPRRGRQHDVGPLHGLGHLVVHDDHEVQARQRLVQPVDVHRLHEHVGERAEEAVPALLRVGHVRVHRLGPAADEVDRTGPRGPSSRPGSTTARCPRGPCTGRRRRRSRRRTGRCCPVSAASSANARPVRSPWYQWFEPPPMRMAAGFARRVRARDLDDRPPGPRR